MDFAVHIKGLHEEDKGSWVLAVTPDGLVAGGQVLIAHDDDQTLHWYPMGDCTLARVHGPDQPSMVMAVTAKPSAANGKIALANQMPNRQMRRHGGEHN